MLRKHFRIVLIIVLITWTSGSPSCPAADRKLIGLNYNFSRHFMMGYRLQHMSNAGIYTPNPGVNIHMLAIGYQW